MSLQEKFEAEAHNMVIKKQSPIPPIIPNIKNSLVE